MICLADNNLQVTLERQMTPAASRLKRRRNPAQGQTWCLLSRLLHVRNERKSKPMNDLVKGHYDREDYLPVVR